MGIGGVGEDFGGFAGVAAGDEELRGEKQAAVAEGAEEFAAELGDARAGEIVTNGFGGDVFEFGAGLKMEWEMVRGNNGVQEIARRFRDGRTGETIARIGLRVGREEGAVSEIALQRNGERAIDRRTLIFLEAGVGIDLCEFLRVGGMTQ